MQIKRENVLYILDSDDHVVCGFYCEIGSSLICTNCLTSSKTSGDGTSLLAMKVWPNALVALQALSCISMLFIVHRIP